MTGSTLILAVSRLLGPQQAVCRLRAMSRSTALTAVGFAAILATGTGSAGAAESCENNSDALGVSRTIVIDTKGGKLYGRDQYRKNNEILKDKEVVLTFDDGPSPRRTREILDALDKHCTKATFFMLGEMARKFPSTVKDVAARGHTVGSHTWSHKNLGARSKSRGIWQIELGISTVSKALGKPSAPFFRFPYLSGPKRMIKYLKSRDMGVFSIDVDSKDYRTRSGSTVTNKIMRDLKRKGKGILLFHDIQISTVRAMPTLLKKLQRAGYKVVHITAKAPVVTKKSYDAKAAKLIKGGRKLVAKAPVETKKDDKQSSNSSNSGNSSKRTSGIVAEQSANTSATSAKRRAAKKRNTRRYASNARKRRAREKRRRARARTAKARTAKKAGPKKNWLQDFLDN